MLYGAGGIQADVPGGSEFKVSACNVVDLGLISGSGRSPGEEHGNPLQYSCPRRSQRGWRAPGRVGPPDHLWAQPEEEADCSCFKLEGRQDFVGAWRQQSTPQESGSVK